MNDTQPYIDRICPVCGKTFLPAPMHIYKDKRNYSLVCSYTCMLETERLKGKDNRKKVGDNSAALNFLRLRKNGVTRDDAKKFGIVNFYEDVSYLIDGGFNIVKEKMKIGGRKLTVYRLVE